MAYWLDAFELCGVEASPQMKVTIALMSIVEELKKSKKQVANSSTSNYCV